MSVGLGDVRVEVGEAARWLRDKYNPTTVRFYDYAGTDDLAAARSPPDTVTLEDLGRLVCIAAGLRYERAHTLLDTEAEVPWPETEIVPLATVDGDDDEFLAHPSVQALWDLFDFWDSRTGLGFATVAKLLHLKWPNFIPVTDSEVMAMYRPRAVRKHNASTAIPGTRQRTTANISAYWLAFREDLLAAQGALGAVREALNELDDPETDDANATGHVERVRGLTDVRLLDMLAWGLGRKSPGLHRHPRT